MYVHQAGAAVEYTEWCGEWWIILLEPWAVQNFKNFKFCRAKFEISTVLTVLFGDRPKLVGKASPKLVRKVADASSTNCGIISVAERPRIFRVKPYKSWPPATSPGGRRHVADRSRIDENHHNNHSRQSYDCYIVTLLEAKSWLYKPGIWDGHPDMIDRLMTLLKEINLICEL